MIKFSGTLQKFENNLWSYHIKVPDKVAHKLKASGIKRFKCALNDNVPFHASLMPAGEGVYFIKINQELRTINNIKLEDTVLVKIIKDESQYGMPLPVEMEELFLQDPEGDLYFHKLTPGKQRSLIYLIGKIKSTEKRIEKSVIIMEHLKELKGGLDFKVLNQDFKDKKGML